jgi:hypothetical protein
MDHGNLLVKGHPLESILYPLLYAVRLIEIDGLWLGCRHRGNPTQHKG